MSVKSSLLYKVSLAITTCLMTTAMNAVTTTILGETATTIAAAINNISPLYKYAGTDPINITSISSNTAGELNGASAGTFSLTTGTSSYFILDTSANTLKALAPVGGTWKTFAMTSVPTSWNATTTLSLAETVRDGATNPASPYSLSIILTKTGSVSDLTNSVLGSFLASNTVSSLAANNTGTALTGTSALTTGWTAKAYVANNASAAQAVTLDPVSFTLGNTATTTVGTALSFSGAISGIVDWNVATNSTAAKSVILTAPGGRSVSMNAFPAGFVRTAGVASGLISSLNNMPTIYNQTASGYQSTLSNAIADVQGILSSTPGALKDGILTAAAGIVSGLVIGDFTTKADTNKIGLVALTSADITNVTWSVDGKNLIANGKIGSGPLKNFSCDMTGKTTVNSTTNAILKFTASDGDAFFLDCVDATGYTSTANTSIPAGDQDTELAMMLASTLSATATIAHSTLADLL